MSISSSATKRVVVIHWKNSTELSFEVFSNLKNLCLSYPAYNYNTLNNYLSKRKIPYENDMVRIERKNIFLQKKENVEIKVRKIAAVVTKVPLKDDFSNEKDLTYWREQPISARAEAVTFIVSQYLKPGERLNKVIVNKQKIRP